MNKPMTFVSLESLVGLSAYLEPVVPRHHGMVRKASFTLMRIGDGNSGITDPTVEEVVDSVSFEDKSRLFKAVKHSVATTHIEISTADSWAILARLCDKLLKLLGLR